MPRVLTTADQEESELSLLSSRRHSDCDSLQYLQNDPDRNPIMPMTKGRVRAYWLGALLNLAGFQFGYDSGIVGGVCECLASFANKRARLIFH